MSDELNRDAIAVVLAFQRQDRLALRTLLEAYKGREGHLRIIGALASLVITATEDVLHLTADIEGRDGLEDVGFTVEEALEKMLLKMASDAG